MDGDSRGPGGVYDLGALRDRRAAGGPQAPVARGQAVYANDARVALDLAGNLTIEFFFTNDRAEYEATVVTMPVPVFMEVANLAPQVMQQMQARMGQAAKAAARAMSEGDVDEGLDAARRARDAGKDE